MDQAAMEQFRLKLLDLKSELQEQEESSREATRPVELDQSSVGRLSRMDAMQAQQMALETSRRRKHQLQRIDGALRYIGSGGYGHCFVCGEEIDLRRLTADPAHTRCIRCVEL